MDNIGQKRSRFSLPNLLLLVLSMGSAAAGTVLRNLARDSIEKSLLEEGAMEFASPVWLLSEGSTFSYSWPSSDDRDSDDALSTTHTLSSKQ